MGERKEEMHEGGEETRIHGEGRQGRDRGGEAQTGSGLVILRYHVLRITVPIHMYVYVTYRMYVPHIQGHTIPCSGCTYLLFFLFLPLLPLPFRSSRLPFLFRSLFSNPPCILFSPLAAAAAEGSACLLFAAETRVSLAHSLEGDRLQSVLKYRHAVYSMERVAYDGRARS